MSLPDFGASDKGSRVQVSKDADGPSVELFDEAGKSRAVLGVTKLKSIRSGSTEVRAPSSLVLFDKEGKVVWEAPW